MNWNKSITVDDSIKNLLWKGAFYIVLITGLYCSFQAFWKHQLPYLFFGVLPCGLACGVLIVKAFLPGLSEKFAMSLFMPRSFLKKAPLVLSPYYRMFADEKYVEVYTAIAPLIEKHQEDPDLVLLYAQTCMKLENGEGTAMGCMENLFRISDRMASQNHAKLLFFYADTAVKYRGPAFVCEVVENELRRSIYTDLEKNAIRVRLMALKGRVI